MATELEAGGQVTLTIRKQRAMDAAAQLTVVPLSGIPGNGHAYSSDGSSQARNWNFNPPR